MTAMAQAAASEVVIRTPRLTLAPLAPSYAAPLFELLNDWEVVRMLSEVPWPLVYDDVETFLAKPSSTSDNFVLLRGTDPIGVAGVKRPGSGEPPRKMPRLGYWIGQRHWGHGFGTEAAGALVDYAFRTYPQDRVGAGVFQDNPASQRVLEKLGLSRIGPKVTQSRSRGGPVETVDMQITRSDWVARSAGR